MNKTSSLVIIAVVIVAGLFFVPQFRNYFKNQFGRTTETQVKTEMSGTVTKVEKDSIVVEGLVGSKNKSITFIITPETILRNSSRTITAEQMKSGKSFVPKFEQKAGIISDFTVNLKIDKIKSKENLLITNNTIATEIDYAIFTYPTK